VKEIIRSTVIVVAITVIVVVVAVSYGYVMHRVGYVRGLRDCLDNVSYDLGQCWFDLCNGGDCFSMRFFNISQGKGYGDCDLLREMCIRNFPGFDCRWVEYRQTCDCDFECSNKSIESVVVNLTVM